MTPRIWPAYLFAAFLCLALVLTVVQVASGDHGGGKRGTVTWYEGGCAHCAATTHHSNDLTWKQGSVLRLEKGTRHFVVRVTDYCEGDSCQDADVSPTAFTALGVRTSAGVARVRFYCGRGGHLDIHRCLAGEG